MLGVLVKSVENVLVMLVTFLLCRSFPRFALPLPSVGRR